MALSAKRIEQLKQKPGLYLDGGDLGQGLYLQVTRGGASWLSAQSITLDGLARTVSAYSIVGKVCSSVIPVDRANVQKAIEASLELGAKQFALEQARAAVRTEMDRRSKEVAATGTLPWCSYQRDHLIQPFASFSVAKSPNSVTGP
jgi:hypothetical protein